MSVLTLAGKAIDWANPPKPTTKVLWSQKDTSGRKVIGSLRTIAHLDHLNTLAKKKYGVGIEVMQPPFNTGVVASAGTHDFDACLDVRIPGVPWEEQQRFFRANGAGAYYRKPPLFVPHIHYFTLPPREGTFVGDDYRAGGFKVGKYVDGGYSLYGRAVASSQLDDYYNHRTALAGHAHDPSWFPDDITDSIFDLPAYMIRQRRAQVETQAPVKPTRERFAVVNVPAKVGRANWATCFQQAHGKAEVFGLNESLTKAQRDLYEEMAEKRDLGSFGLRKSGNPVFWDKGYYKSTLHKVHQIHPAATGELARKYPGFNAERTITEVVLRRKTDGREFAILNTHLVPDGVKVDSTWRNKVRRKSKRMLRRLVRKHRAAGRVVIVMGDMNIAAPFWLGKGMHWLRGEGIDKIGSSVKGDARIYPAPTDHKHGVLASIVA